jgi:hypothetical protein
MTVMTVAVDEMLSKAAGRSLKQVAASLHSFEGRLGNTPICLWLVFEGLQGFRLFGAADGWHIGVDDAQPEPVDMGGSGEIVIHDISRESIFREMLNRTLKGGWTIESPTRGSVIGVRFDFGLPVKPLVLNWGDEIYLGDDFPHDAKRSEILEVPAGGECGQTELPRV